MDPLTTALAWIKIGQAIVAGGAELMAEFKQFLTDHGIEVDNANLDKQIADDQKRKAEEQDIINGNND